MRWPFKRTGFENETSATTIVAELAAKGISRDKISGRHLRGIYRQLKIWADIPDFSAIRGIFPHPPAPVEGDGPPVLGVIVETRPHTALAHVIANALQTLNIPIQLLHGRNNLEYILSEPIAEHVKAGTVFLTALDIDALTASKYNALLMSEEFWRQLGTRRKVMIFQTDSIFCSRSDYTLADFHRFDYIGAKWKRQRPIGLTIEGGNGGLSLRDWNRSVECLQRFPPKQWPGGEDGYFAFHMDVMGGTVARMEDCAKFATQDEFLYKSFGAHQITRLDEASEQRFLEYCPDACFMRRVSIG